MAKLEDAKRLFHAGDPDGAVALVAAAAEDGDSEAGLAIAHWRLFGLYGPRSLPQADHYLRCAARTSAEARRLHLYLRANGTLGTLSHEQAVEELRDLAVDDPVAQQQMRLLDAAEEENWRTEPVSEIPSIRMVRHLFSSAECAYLQQMSAPRLRPSTILDPQTGARRPDPVRTSVGAALSPVEEDLVVGMLNRRIAAATDTDRMQGEPLHILRYSGAQEYRPHHDAVAGLENQRSHTLIVYLNADYEGGETAFPELGLRLRGRQGDALLFANLREDGRPDLRMRHAGLPATSGAKWIATRWIRTRPYHVWKDG